MVYTAWDLSNENLSVEESRLTYFTVRDTLKLQMKQEKKRENLFLFFVPYKIISSLHGSHKAERWMTFPGASC